MIFVTGGAGYIGSHCVKLLDERNHDVIVYDNLSRGHREMVCCGRFVEGELSDVDRMAELFRTYRVDTVIHLAASGLVGESEEAPHKYYKNNVSGGISLLEAMLKGGVRQIVFSSSATVYGEPASLPITEEHPTSPLNVYGHTKLIFETILKQYAAVYGIRAISLRYFNAAGADLQGLIGEDHTPETHLVPLLLDVAIGRRPDIAILGDDYDTPDGTCIRDYVHVSDLALAHILAADQLKSGGAWAVYNLGSERGYSVREVHGAAERVTGSRIPVRVLPRRKGDPSRLVASSEKIRRVLQWQPTLSGLERIMETAWQWHRKRFG